MTRFFSYKNEDETTTTNDAPSEAVVLSDEELEAVAGGYIIAGPAGQLDWWRRQQYYKNHPGQVHPLVANTVE